MASIPLPPRKSATIDQRTREPTGGEPTTSTLAGGSDGNNPRRSPAQLLLRMGVPKHRAEKAIAATGERGVQLASDWLLAHVNDPTLDDNMPREYILYACPVGPLLDQLQVFWYKSLTTCGRNGAHNYLPHITLCSFFKAPDDSVTHLINSLTQVVDKFRDELPDKLKLERYTSPIFIGLFVVEEHAEILKKLAVQYVKEVANHIASEYEQVDAFTTCFPWCSAASHAGSYRSLGRNWTTSSAEPYMKSLHVTLAYQFAPAHYSLLEELSLAVDCDISAQWDVRLYSRDARISGNEVHKVLYSHIPSEADELELLIGDFMYVNGDHLNSSTDGWVEGTSWLTGCTGFLPKTYIEKTAESDAWTLHKSIPLLKNGTIDKSIQDVSALTTLNANSRLIQQRSHSKEKLSTSGNSFIGSEASDCGCSPGGTLIYENVEALYAKINKPKKGLSANMKPRQLIVIRHAERVDFTFGAWIPICFDESGNYIRCDLNMPKTVPPRKGGPQDFFKDCPLTEIGLKQASLVGDAIGAAGVAVTHVYCSPSLRCVQTCTNVLNGMGLQHLPICIEPGLFEWLAWYQDSMPSWMSLQELKTEGYNIEMNYRPYITAEELHDRREASEQYYMRSYYVTQSIIKSTAEKGGNILLVGHAATVDTCTRQLCGKEPRSAGDLTRLVHKVPYCSVGMAEETTPGSWKLIPPVCPPVTHANNLRFDWKVLSN